LILGALHWICNGEHPDLKVRPLTKVSLGCPGENRPFRPIRNPLLYLRVGAGLDSTSEAQIEFLKRAFVQVHKASAQSRVVARMELGAPAGWSPFC